MNTIQVKNAIIQKLYARNCFAGVFAIDILPIKLVKRPTCFILNTEKSTENGSHWIALYLPSRGPIEYFDSFGVKPINNEIYEFINLNGKHYIYNGKQIQHNTSKTCGKYCVIFILFRNKGLTYNKFLNMFSNNTNYNETLIKTLFDKII